MQMGGFQYNNDFPPDSIATGTAVANEPSLSNVRGTVAMAKLGGNANSATSQFFINLSDNSSNLDVQNGGFTVFGQVLDDGMTVVDRIAALPKYRYGAPFSEIPLRDFSATDFTNNVTPNDDNVVIISDIVIIDTNTITNPDLNPVNNTLLNAETGGASNSSGGGGSLGFGLGLLLVSAAVYRLTQKSQKH